MPECYEEPTLTNLGVALFIITGTVGSYIPQFIVIVRKKSSEGISFVMLGILLLRIGTFCVGVCNTDVEKTAGQCLKNNLATEQLVASLILTFILYILFLVYFPTVPAPGETHAEKLRAKIVAISVFIAVVALSILLSVLGGVLYYTLKFTSKVLKGYAQALGTASSILMIVEWAPQILTTWRMKSPGSLSVLMLIIQMPGSLLVMYFQAILNSADFTTWGPYFFQFVEQGALVAMCAFFWYQERKSAQKKAETQPLLEEVRLDDEKPPKKSFAQSLKNLIS